MLPLSPWWCWIQIALASTSSASQIDAWKLPPHCICHQLFTLGTCYWHVFDVNAQWFIKENFWMILVCMMTVMITTRRRCKACNTEKQQSYNKIPCSPIKKASMVCLFILSALECMLKKKKKSISCLSVGLKCLCRLVKWNCQWRLEVKEWQRRNIPNQESVRIHSFIHVPTSAIYTTKKQEWFHFDTWINTCFMVLL